MLIYVGFNGFLPVQQIAPQSPFLLQDFVWLREMLAVVLFRPRSSTVVQSQLLLPSKYRWQFADLRGRHHHSNNSGGATKRINEKKKMKRGFHDVFGVSHCWQLLLRPKNNTIYENKTKYAVNTRKLFAAVWLSMNFTFYSK